MPETVGNGNDIAAQASGLIVEGAGWFSSVTGVTSENDSTGANHFSLQLNSNFFVTSVCNGAANPSNCRGWQQFIFSNASAVVFMQYWLINFGATCPAGWHPFSGDCFRNSAATAVPSQTIANLIGLRLEGTAVRGTDSVLLSERGLEFFAVGQDTVLNLQQGWTTAEFNVFGDGAGRQAVFNSGSTIVVSTGAFNPTTSAPSCVSDGFTGETNNLTLVPPPEQLCCVHGGAFPAIEFMESNAVGATATCGTEGLQAQAPPQNGRHLRAARSLHRRAA